MFLQLSSNEILMVKKKKLKMHSVQLKIQRIVCVRNFMLATRTKRQNRKKIKRRTKLEPEDNETRMILF